MGTPHNSAKKGDIAKKVLMPGDPLRAKFIAETYLENPVCFNTVRNVLGYTGTYKGKEVSVMASGMGCSSIGIYSYELYHFYDVDQIIRVGSAGSLQDDVNIMDVVIAMGACTDTSYANQYCLPGTFAPIASYDMVAKAVEAANKLNVPVKVGNVLSSEVFYNENTSATQAWRKMGVLCTEMECAALFMNAARAGKEALGIMTISDHIIKGGEISAEERQTSFRQMMEIALEV
ncbi:MAG: purine-nucleoside phosphorylase [Eubacteriales bacterium]|nr:purine-nucleoside phosphorylase [Eubacteriales bacterium]